MGNKDFKKLGTCVLLTFLLSGVIFTVGSATGENNDFGFLPLFTNLWLLNNGMDKKLDQLLERVNNASLDTMLINPSYDELISFLKNDTVSDLKRTDQFVCGDFSHNLLVNAENQGFNASLVLIYFTDGTAHTLVGFTIIDQGFIYVEPSDDNILTVKVGVHLWGSNGYFPQAYDVIDRVLVFP